MCKSCFCSALVSGIATWAFFGLLLRVLGVANAGVNALLLTLLIFVAVMYCPILNQSIAKSCKTKKKR